MILSISDSWHARKDYTTNDHYSLHDQLEDGTIPFHNIIALGKAMEVHRKLFRSMERVSSHTADLTARLYTSLRSLKYTDGTALCIVYTDSTSTPGDPKTHGATLAFNLQRADGELIPYTEVEALADAQGIYVRSGGMCNPGGIATYLDLAPWEMKRAYSAGHRCGHATQLVSGKPTGVVRASLGAMSTRTDIERLVAFLKATFLPEGETEEKKLCQSVDARYEAVVGTGGQQCPGE